MPLKCSTAVATDPSTDLRNMCVTMVWPTRVSVVTLAAAACRAGAACAVCLAGSLSELECEVSDSELDDEDKGGDGGLRDDEASNETRAASAALCAVRNAVAWLCRLLFSLHINTRCCDCVYCSCNC